MRKSILSLWIFLLAMPLAAERGWMKFGTSVSNLPDRCVPGQPYYVTDAGDNCTSSGSTTRLCYCDSAGTSYFSDALTGGTTIDKLGDIANVTISGQAAGDLLIWDGSTLWLNKAMSGDTTITAAGVVSIGNDKITPDMLKSTGQTDEYALTYEVTGDTLEWAAAGSMPDKEYNFPAVALYAGADPANQFPRITHHEGTNIDRDTMDFPAVTSDTCAGSVFRAHSDMDTSGTVTFETRWITANTNTGDVIWEFNHVAIADGEDWDAALTSEEIGNGVCNGSGTIDEEVVCSWTETVSNLGWAAGDEISFLLCRDISPNDDHNASAQLTFFTVRMPRS